MECKCTLKSLALLMFVGIISVLSLQYLYLTSNNNENNIVIGPLTPLVKSSNNNNPQQLVVIERRKSTPEILETNDHESNKPVERGGALSVKNSTNKQLEPNNKLSSTTTTTQSPTTKVEDLSTDCLPPPCVEYLNEDERKVYNKCLQRIKPSHTVVQCKCRFREREGHKRVALNSIEGSGNTWVRGLIEKTSGLCTGALLCDTTLRKGGFCGEGLRGTNLIAVKTHHEKIQWQGDKITDPTRPPFDKAILIVRSPFDVNIAEHNRGTTRSDDNKSSHVKFVSSKTSFGSNGNWGYLVRKHTSKWKSMIINKMKASLSGRPVLVVFYEEIKKDPAQQLARMMEFLEVSISPTDISTALKEDFITFYRNHTDDFDHYTKEQRMFVNSVITNTADSIHDEHIATYLREYIQN